MTEIQEASVNGKTPTVAKAYDSSSEDNDDDDDSLSNSDSDSETSRKIPITIERSADLATLKNAFLTCVKTNSSKGNNEELDTLRIGKESLNEIAGIFENCATADITKEANADKKYDREKIVIDKDSYSALKNKFASQTQENTAQNREKIEIERNEADKKRIKRLFYENASDNAGSQTEDWNCEKCQKLVYHVDKVKVGRRMYHKTCLACQECEKSLNGISFIIVQGKPYCRFHALKILVPDQNITEEMAETMQISTDVYENEEFEVVEALNADTTTTGEHNHLESMPTLREKKKEWEEQAGQSTVAKIDHKRIEDDTLLIEQGRVKSHTNRFSTNYETNGHREDFENGNLLDNEQDYQNANIARPVPKKKEELTLDIDAKKLKSKFEEGTLSTISPKSVDLENRLSELNALRNDDVVPVKERFKPDSQKEDQVKAKPSLDDITPTMAACIHEAKQKFAKGEAGFEDSVVSYERHKDVVFSELSRVKERFEQQGRKSEEKVSACASSISSKCHELETLKASFESGGPKKRVGDDETENKRKKQLEHEFRRLQIEKGIFNEKQRREAEEEARNRKNVPYDEETENVQKCPELGSIKQKFEQGGVPSESPPTKLPVLEEIGQIDHEASKSIKAKFESQAFNEDSEMSEEKRRYIQAEFEQFKELKEKQREVNQEEDSETLADESQQVNTELALAAEHGQKMKARWDKIQRKEAKKAQKAANLKPKQPKPSS